MVVPFDWLKKLIPSGKSSPCRGPLLRERQLKAIHNQAMELWVVGWITVKCKIPLSPSSHICLVTVVADLNDLEYRCLSTIPLVVTEDELHF